MGFLLVEYPTVREVFIDGVQFGRTNTPLQVSNGYHCIDLGTSYDYSPSVQRVKVQGEPYQAPITASFQPR
jgi:PEGA domain